MCIVSYYCYNKFYLSDSLRLLITKINVILKPTQGLCFCLAFEYAFKKTLHTFIQIEIFLPSLHSLSEMWNAFILKIQQSMKQ